MFYTKDKISEILKCKKCKQKLDEPKILACGAAICSTCAMKLQVENHRYECVSCAKSHLMAEEGLPTSESLLVLLELEPDEIYRGETVELFKETLNQIKEKLKSIRFCINNGYDQITEHCNQIENEIQLNIEQHMLDVNDYHKELSEKIAEYKSDCLTKLEHNRLEESNYNEIISELEWFCKEWSSYLTQPKLNDDTIKKAHDFGLKLLEKATIELKKLSDLIFNGSLLKLVKGQFITVDKVIGTLKLDEIGSTILTNSQINDLFTLCGFKLDDTWSLAYKASKHGFSAQDFHTRVADLKGTFVLIKSANGFIFGGYTEQNWSGDNVYKQDPNAFVFSLVNKYNKPLILECCMPEYAIYCRQDYGPTFGGGHDLYVCSDCNKVKSSYSKLSHSYCLDRNEDQQTTFLAGGYNFLVSDIEVYSKNS